MKVKEKKWIRFRIYLISLCFFLGLGTVLARSYHLQIIKKDHFKGIAQEDIIGTTRLPPERGIIYDRRGHELALTVQVGSIFAHPKQVSDFKEAARTLAPILEESEASILSTLERKAPFVWVKRKVPMAIAGRVNSLPLKGIGVTHESGRYYPGRTMAAHVIGFVGMDNLGLEGIEKQYDRFLAGPENTLYWVRDALGRPFSIEKPESSGQGLHHLVLTIDKDIQYAAQKALKSAVASAGARAGHCLVIDPHTGEVLAMAVVPEFNPNAIRTARPEQWRNRSVTDAYEPGSTLKAFLLAAALEEAVVKPDSVFDCEKGRYRIGGRTVRDTHGHDLLTVREIGAKSSNIGCIKIGQKLGYERYVRYLESFGFGARTEIGLLGEREGFIREPEKAREIDRATVYFGQGMTATSMQMAMAMAAIANGGNLMRPYIVKRIVDESGHPVQENRPQLVRRVISTHTAKTVTTILERVVSKEGTGLRAAIYGFSVAGKTGTAQKVDPETRHYSRDKFVSSFVGFAPADQPRLVILVVVDEPQGRTYGGVVAAPVFREVGTWALNYLKVNPDPALLAKNPLSMVPVEKEEPEAEAGIYAEAIAEIASALQVGLLPDFRGMGMRDVLKKGHSLGLRVSLEGSGLAVEQDPEAGVPLQQMESVRVRFQPPSS